MGEVGEGVSISEGDEEPVKADMRTRRRCRRRHKQAPPRVPAISPCRRVGEEEEASEVDADVEVEARGRRATQSRSLIGRKKMMPHKFFA